MLLKLLQYRPERNVLSSLILLGQLHVHAHRAQVVAQRVTKLYHPDRFFHDAYPFDGATDIPLEQVVRAIDFFCL
jgi:hypothetical protein